MSTTATPNQPQPRGPTMVEAWLWGQEVEASLALFRRIKRGEVRVIDHGQWHLAPVTIHHRDMHKGFTTHRRVYTQKPRYRVKAGRRAVQP